MQPVRSPKDHPIYDKVIALNPPIDEVKDAINSIINDLFSADNKDKITEKISITRRAFVFFNCYQEEEKLNIKKLVEEVRTHLSKNSEKEQKDPVIIKVKNLFNKEYNDKVRNISPPIPIPPSRHQLASETTPNYSRRGSESSCRQESYLTPYNPSPSPSNDNFIERMMRRTLKNPSVSLQN